MRKRNTNQVNRLEYLWFLLLLGLPAIAWYGSLDQYSSATITDSTTAAGLIYGTARGINALVSVLQGTELDMVFLSFSIGEVLDPVNDLIERFSTLVLFALGSLALQKILLTVVSHTLFNTTISLLALAAAISFFIDNKRLYSAMLKSFIAVAFLRFSLGLVVIANGWVDAVFLNMEDEKRHAVMMNLQSELREIDTLARKDREASAQLAQAQGKQANLETRKLDLGYQIKLAEQEINEQTRSLENLIAKEGLPCTWVGMVIACPEHIDNSAADLERLKIHRTALASELDDTREQLKEVEKDMSCLERRKQGEECSIWDKIPEAPNPVALRNKLSGINENLTEFSDNCVNLLMSLLLKTIFIPLLFIYFLLKVLRSNWTRI
jgi:predicted  nucleic acid-binding Zn-ribbon protein